jgi:hypothetical protein
MKLVGFEKMKARLEGLPVKWQSAHKRALLKAGLFLQRESQEICPVKTGALRNSARTWAEPPSGGGFNVIVYVGYIGVLYAIIQHENLEFHHKEGTQAKFLENPAREKRLEILKVYQEALIEK